ncbi:MAG: hypothetical protein KDA20_04750 [Phycisphaerales bacterium]|nr:hypothetical protein [Phycisphaerales bacterium]
MTHDPANASSGDRREEYALTRRAFGRWLVALLAVHALLVAPGLIAHFAAPERVIRLGREDTRVVPPEWRDADGYHLPVIDTMREQWPAIDIVHYDSATAPGYHAFMSTVAIVLGGRAGNVDAALWVVNALVGLGCIAVVFVTTARFARPPTAFLLTLPIACCSYVVAASTWLTTDNAAMLFVVLALGGALCARLTAWRGVRTGVYGAAAVAIRQNCAWLAAPIGLTAVLHSPLQRMAPRAYRGRGHVATWRPFIGGAIGALMPLGVAAFLIVQWGGLLPKSSDGWSEYHNLGPNLATPTYAIALVACFGVFFVAIAWREIVELRSAPKAPLVFGMIAFVAAIAVPTASTRSTEAWGSAEWRMRNYGILWRVVDELPAVAHRSVLIAVLAPMGAIMLLALYRAARRAQRGPQALVLLTGLSGWLAAQTMNSMAWQRYFEPITLLTLAWLCAMAWGPAWVSASAMRRRVMVGGPIVLALGLIGITVLKAHVPSFAYLASL